MKTFPTKIVDDPQPKHGKGSHQWRRVPYNVVDNACNKAKTIWRDIIVEEVDIDDFERMSMDERSVNVVGGVPQSSRPGFSESSGNTTRLARRRKNPKQKRQILAKIDFGPLAHRYFYFEYRLL